MTAERRILAATLLALLLLGLGASAQAVTYYVRTTGSDGNSGLSPATAWATVEHAGDTMVAGDVVYIGGGTYTDRVDVQNSGTAGNPIRFIADTTGAFTGDAGSVVINDGGDAFDVDNEDYITIIGIRTTGADIGFKFKNAEGIVLQDCEADGHDDRGVEIDKAEVQISNCDFHDNDKEGIRIKGDGSIVTITQVQIRDNDAEGLRLDHDRAQLNLDRCDIYGNDDEGIYLKKGTAVVTNCIIRNNGTHGIELDNDDADLELWHATIVGNTGDGIYQDKGDSVIRNSIIASNGGDGLDRDDGSMVHTYNLVWNNGSQDYEGTSASTGEISLDPVFVGGTDYHLQASSPAIDAGIDASAVTSEDRDGLARPQGWGWDMGAYEFPVPPHFEIVHDGAALSCEEETITLRAHDSAHAVDTAYTGTVSLSTSTSHGDWSLIAGAGTLVNSGNGAASYTFVAADAGEVTLGLLNNYGETLNIDATDGTLSEHFDEDPDLVWGGGGGSDDFRDDFDTVSWSNQDGSLPWSGPWIEVDSVAGPGAGNARVAGGELVLEDFPNTDLDISVEREADLSSTTSATFLFDFRTTSGVDANDAVFVEVSDDGGVSWTVLERITGITGASSASRSFDISAFTAIDTRVRFRVDGLNGTGGSSCCYGASDEEFRVEFAQIVVPLPELCGPDHYAISHDGSAVNCQVENVTITSHDQLHALYSDWTGTITLSTSTGNGDWSLVSGGGVLVNAGNGDGTYTFAAADLGAVVLGLLDSFTETVNIHVFDGDAGEAASEDPDLVVAGAGFSFLADGVASSIGPQIGGKPSDVAPGAQSLELEAIRTSPTTGACEAALQGPNPVELAFTCEDPTTCAGAQVSINGTPIAANPSGPPISWTPVNLDFGDDTDTTAPFTMVYPDVGRIQLHARYTLVPSGEDLSGASNAFVERPFAFELTATGNPGATDENGALFTAAGANFTANARAVLWQAADDLDADGVADGHDDADPLNNVNLADNPAASSYGRESSVEGVLLASRLLAPSGGNDPGLGGATTIASLVGGFGSTAGVYFDEVGLIELEGSVPDGDYLGIGAAESARIAGRSSHVGRFRPDHFDVTLTTAPALATGCAAGGFTYVGDSFGYATAPVVTVTARSARNSLTQNYTDVWWKLSNATLANRTYTADPAHPVALDVTGLPPTAADPAIGPGAGIGNLGVGTLTFGLGSGLRFGRAGPVAPFDAEIALSIDILDGDGVAYAGNPFSIGAPSVGNGMAWSAGGSQRYGRLALPNAFGSELAPLPVPLRSQYWNGSAFIHNGDDSCSVVTAAHVLVTATDPVALDPTPVLVGPLIGGERQLTFSAPGVEGWADVLVNLSPAGANLPYLTWDWSGDGTGPTYDESPAARLNFGIDAGQGPVIFRREIY